MSREEMAASQGPTNVEKLRGLPWGIGWSVANSVFAKYTFFGSIFVLETFVSNLSPSFFPRLRGQQQSQSCSN